MESNISTIIQYVFHWAEENNLVVERIESMSTASGNSVAGTQNKTRTN
jgi:hypothetical protein